MEELSSGGVASLESKASLLPPSAEGCLHPKSELKVREGSINMRHAPLKHMNSMPDLRKLPQNRPGATPVSGPVQQQSSDDLEEGRQNFSLPSRTLTSLQSRAENEPQDFSFSRTSTSTQSGHSRFVREKGKNVLGDNSPARVPGVAGAAAVLMAVEKFKKNRRPRPTS